MKIITFVLKKMSELLIKVSMISLLISSTSFLIAREQNSNCESNDSELIRFFKLTLLADTNNVEYSEMCSEELLDSLVDSPEIFIRDLSKMTDPCILAVCQIISAPTNDKITFRQLQTIRRLLSCNISHLKTRFLVMAALQCAIKRYD